MQHRETGYNLFAFIENDLITKVGIKSHLLPQGTLSEKTTFLAHHAEKDLARAVLYPIPSEYLTFDPYHVGNEYTGIPYLVYAHMQAKRRGIKIYINALRGENAPAQPLVYYHNVFKNKIIESHY